MPYDLSLDDATEIITVQYQGSVSLNERKQAVADVCGKFADAAPFKIIVDVINLTMDLSFDEQHEFGQYLASHAGLSNARVAVLHEPDFNPNVVIDASAFSNGYTLAEFNDLHDAQLWLCQL